MLLVVNVANVWIVSATGRMEYVYHSDIRPEMWLLMSKVVFTLNGTTASFVSLSQLLMHSHKKAMNSRCRDIVISISVARLVARFFAGNARHCRLKRPDADVIKRDRV